MSGSVESRTLKISKQNNKNDPGDASLPAAAPLGT